MNPSSSTITDSMPSIIEDDDTSSVVAHDSSESTVSTQTSTSWHSVLSDININNNLIYSRHFINNWTKMCSVEPDIRLTTAQEWKLRTCIRHLLSLCNHPLKIICSKPISSMNQDQQTLLRNQDEISGVQQLALYLRISSITHETNNSLDVKLFEFYSQISSNITINRIPITKMHKFVYYISLNKLKLTFKSHNSLLELQISTKENDYIHGYYYKWNETQNLTVRYDTLVEIDQNLFYVFDDG